MSELKNYRRKKDLYNYFTIGHYHFLKNVSMYAGNIREFKMYENYFNLSSCYQKYAKKYLMLHYIDPKEKTIEVKFLDRKTKQEVFYDSYSLSPTSYLMMRETRNYLNGLYTRTMVNPSNKYGHVTMYFAQQLVDKKMVERVNIFRNKTDFASNFNCVYIIKDNAKSKEYLQIEKDISSILLAYNNTTYPTADMFSAKQRSKDATTVFDKYKSNRDMLTQVVSTKQNLDTLSNATDGTVNNGVVATPSNSSIFNNNQNVNENQNPNTSDGNSTDGME